MTKILSQNLRPRNLFRKIVSILLSGTTWFLLWKSDISLLFFWNDYSPNYNFFLSIFAGIIHQLGSCHLCLVIKRRRNRPLLEMKILVVNQLVNLLRKVITSLDFFFFILVTKILKLALFQLPRMEIRTIIQFLVLLSQKIKMLSLRLWRITGWK